MGIRSRGAARVASAHDLHPSRMAAAVLTLGLCLGIAGCTSDDHDLPTVGGTATPPPTIEDLVQTAQDYYNCLEGAGLQPSYSLVNGNDSPVTRVELMGDRYTLERRPDGARMNGSAEITPADQKVIDEFWEDESTDYVMVVDGFDRTEIVVGCMAETGYSWEDIDQIDPETLDKTEVRRQVEVNNVWAACARDNGWPNVQDSVMPTDLTDLEWPTILLPFSMEPSQLRLLLEACPNFDPQAEEDRTGNPDRPGNPDAPPDPMIAFDQEAPWFSEDSDVKPTAEEQAMIDHQNALFDVLGEASNAWWDEYMATTSTPGDTVTVTQG